MLAAGRDGDLIGPVVTVQYVVGGYRSTLLASRRRQGESPWLAASIIRTGRKAMVGRAAHQLASPCVSAEPKRFARRLPVARRPLLEYFKRYIA